MGMLGLGAGALAVRPLMGQETAPGGEGTGGTSGKKPNIVLFMVDDMGWQHQHAAYVRTLAENGFTQSMSRKGLPGQRGDRADLRPYEERILSRPRHTGDV